MRKQIIKTITDRIMKKRHGIMKLSLFLLGTVLFCSMLSWEEDVMEPAAVIYAGKQDLLVLMQVENAAAGGENVQQSKELRAPERTVRETEGKVCYLTFDDGPSTNTEKVLDILAQYDAKATFFLIGTNLTEEMRPVMERLLAEGNAVGLHAYEHTYRSKYASLEAFLKDYEKLTETLRKEYQVDTPLFRFPGGSACTYLNGKGKAYIREMHARGYVCFDWNVSGEDSVGRTNAEKICRHVFQDAFRYDHPVILLHDSEAADATVTALPVILERLRQEGYTFETLAEAPEYIFPNNR